MVFKGTEGQGFAIRALLREAAASDMGAFRWRFLVTRACNTIPGVPYSEEMASAANDTPEGPHEGAVGWVVARLALSGLVSDSRAPD